LNLTRIDAAVATAVCVATALEEEAEMIVGVATLTSVHVAPAVAPWGIRPVGAQLAASMRVVVHSAVSGGYKLVVAAVLAGVVIELKIFAGG